MDRTEQNEQEIKKQASLILQILIYFDHYYVYFYLMISLIGMFYKYNIMIYPFDTFIQELFVFIFFSLLLLGRLYIADFGNKSENQESILFFLITSVPTAIGYVFFMFYQTYVIMTDFAVNMIGIIFFGLETLRAALLVVQLRKKSNTKQQSLQNLQRQ